MTSPVVTKKNIIIDLERMRTPNTGLYVYCLHLCKYLEEINHPYLDFYYYIDSKTKIPSTAKRKNRNPLHKAFHFPSKKFKLWHCTFQGSNYIPTNNIKKVYTIHDLNFLYTNKPIYRKRKLLKDIENKIKQADIVTTISHFVKSDIEKNIDVGDKKIKVIYNGISLYKPTAQSIPLKYTPEKEFIFTIGTIQRKKNFHVLPKLLVDNHFELLIAGVPDQNYVQKIMNEAKAYGVEKRVHILNIISEDEKYWYLENCTAFAFPSLSEGFGLPVIEAMLLGKPTLLSKMTSLPEVGGDEAFYFENFELKSLQETLHKALESGKTIEKKAQIKSWANQFSWEKSISEYIKIYEHLLLHEK